MPKKIDSIRRKVNAVLEYTELTYDEIAEQMGVSRPMVYERLKRIGTTNIQSFLELCEICGFDVLLCKDDKTIPITLADSREDEELQKERRK